MSAEPGRAALTVKYGLPLSLLPRLRTFYRTNFRPDHPLLSDLLFDWYFRRTADRERQLRRASVALALASDRIVGHIGVIPVMLRAQGMLFKAAWYVNIYVHSDYTGSGTGSALVAEGLRHYDVVLGLGTTAAGLRLYRRNSYELLGVLRRHIRVLSAEQVRLLVPSANSTTDWLLMEAENLETQLVPAPFRVTGPRWYELPDGYEDLWHRFALRHVASIERSRGYMDWRFGANPDLRYRIIAAHRRNGTLAGVLLFRVEHVSAAQLVPLVRIMDIIADQDAVATLLAAIYFFSKSISACLIEFCCTSSLLDDVLEKSGYISTPHPLTFDVVRLYHPPRLAEPPGIHFSYRVSDNALAVPRNLMRSRHGWYVTMSDSDLDRIQR